MKHTWVLHRARAFHQYKHTAIVTIVIYGMDNPSTLPLGKLCCLLSHTHVFIPNGMLIGSAVFVQLTIENPYTFHNFSIKVGAAYYTSVHIVFEFLWYIRFYTGFTSVKSNMLF